MSFVRAVVVISLIAALTGCSDRKNISPMPSINSDVKRELDSPVNCQTARSDIKLLEDERASVAKQILSGARSVFPFAAVAGILTGDYSDRVQVATGQYNADLEAKIAQIKKACRIN